MPSARQKIWTHQSINGSQRGNGDVCVLDQQLWTTGGLIGVGWTLLRTVVQGYISFGAVWNPAGAAPHANAVDGTGFEFGVWLNTMSSTISAPPPLSDAGRDPGLVWLGNAIKTGATYLPNWDGGNAAYIAHYELPQGRASESYARRLTPGPDFGEVYFQWRFDNEYINTLTDLINGWPSGGPYQWSWTMGFGITIDQLWDQAAA